MKVYKITQGRVDRGIQADAGCPHEIIMLGGGSHNKKVPLFRKNPAEILHHRILDAHPVAIRDGYALARPNNESDKILVFVSSRDECWRGGCERGVGVWELGPKRTFWCENDERVLMAATGPRNYYARQDRENIGWHDAMVTLSVGDEIVVTDENGITARAKYESVEVGLVQQ